MLFVQFLVGCVFPFWISVSPYIQKSMYSNFEITMWPERLREIVFWTDAPQLFCLFKGVVISLIET